MSFVLMSRSVKDIGGITNFFNLVLFGMYCHTRLKMIDQLEVGSRWRSLFYRVLCPILAICPNLTTEKRLKKLPECFVVLSKGFSIWAKGFSVLSKRFSIWAKGFAVLSIGFSIWAKGFVVLSKGFAVMEKGFAVLSKGFAVMEKGFAVLSKGFAVMEKGFAVLSKGFVERENCDTPGVFMFLCRRGILLKTKIF
jgi:hypothetical protein